MKRRVRSLLESLQSSSRQKQLKGGDLQISCDAVLNTPPCSQFKRKLRLRLPPSWLKSSLVFEGNSWHRSRSFCPVSELNLPSRTATTPTSPTSRLIGSACHPASTVFLPLLATDDVSCDSRRPLDVYIGSDYELNVLRFLIGGQKRVGVSDMKKKHLAQAHAKLQSDV